METRCARCGYVAESLEALPEQWGAHLAEMHGHPTPADSEIQVPLCLGCQEERDRYLDARYLLGGEQVDDAVRRFLKDIDLDQIRADSDSLSGTVITD